MESNTPMIDFAPKAISTIIKCQNVLTEYLVPDGISEKECLIKLLEILDNKDLASTINALKDKYEILNNI